MDPRVRRSPDRTITSSQPVRACLSGEDLDWLRGSSVCVALDMRTLVRVGETDEELPAHRRIPVQPWAGEVWRFLQERTRLPAEPPPVVGWTQAPSASGLSSSSALILGLLDAFVQHSCDEQIPLHTIVQWAYEFEFAIFNGGGMDHLAITRGAATLFHGRRQGLPVVADHLAFPPEWAILVVDSGTEKNTRDHIRSVRSQEAANDVALAGYRRTAQCASEVVWSAIQTRDLHALRAGMDLAHCAMRDFQGMSTPFLEALRDVAWAAARIRLKVSGAGGGGALVAVCARADSTRILASLRGGFRDFPRVRVHLVNPAAPRIR